MKDTPPLPMLVLLPGLDGTGKLFAAFVRALGAGVESRVIGYSPDEPLGYEELELQVRASNPHPRLAWARPFAFLLPIKSLPRWVRAPVAVAEIDGPHLLLQACPEECSAAVLKFMTAPQVLAQSASQHFRGNAAGDAST